MFLPCRLLQQKPHEWKKKSLVKKRKLLKTLLSARLAKLTFTVNKEIVYLLGFLLLSFLNLLT